MLVRIGLLALVYFIAGRIGLSLDPVGGFATVVWPPAGIALAALLLYGSKLWPGVFIGALLVNISSGAPALAAIAMAAGNTLEAVAATLFLRKLTSFYVGLATVRDVLALVLAAAASTVIAASIGVFALGATNTIASEQFASAWIAWWIGDTVGILAFTPLVLTWAIRPLRTLDRRTAVEAAAITASLLAMSFLVFGSSYSALRPPFWQAYLLSPLLMWSAIRFYQIGAVTSIAIVSAIAIWGTVLGLGPFTSGPLHMRLEDLQMFMAITTLTFLSLGVLAAERKAAETQLIEAKEAAEAASQAKSRFLAVTSHELRTPLTGIVGYADLLEAGLGGELNDRQQENVLRIKSAAWHLVGIIEDILSFSRAEAGREKVEPEAVDAVVIARAAIALVEPAAEAKGLTLGMQTTHERIPMYTDSRKLSQILVNVLGNAVKFTEQGSVELTMTRDDKWIEFQVRDEGPGIPENELGRIFEAFTQVDQSATRKQGGSGLGLSVALAFSELLGGGITVESVLGAGSTFIVRLPANYDIQPPKR